MGGVVVTGLLAALFAAGYGSWTVGSPSPGALAAEPGALTQSQRPPEETGSSDDLYSGRPWALEQMHLPPWVVAGGGRDVIVAVLDTGIDSTREDLAGKVLAQANFTDSPTSDDINGHGTRVAKIIAADSSNSIGIAGVASKSGLLSVKVADDYGSCSANAVARGIEWAVDQGAKVINISLELKDPSWVLERAIDYAWTHGAVIIAAAGNDASTTPVYPANYANVIAVSATGRSNELAPLSNHGDWVDVAAPGADIWSAIPGNGHTYETGTSFAAAYVSGLAALAFDMATDENGDGKLNDEVRRNIEASCQQTGTSGATHGRVDASKLLSLLSARGLN